MIIKRSSWLFKVLVKVPFVSIMAVRVANNTTDFVEVKL